MGSRQLTEPQRYQIAMLNDMGYNAYFIAEQVGCSHTTIYREIQRNEYKGRYDAGQAHAFAMVRRRFSRKAKVIQGRTEQLVIWFLERKFSPETISKILASSLSLKLSPQSIYNHIENDRREGGKLHKLLPFKGRAKRKDYNYKPWETCILGRKFIDERPNAANKRSREGHLEIDTIISKDRKGGVLTVVDRKTRFMWAEIVKDLNSKTVSRTLLKMLEPVKSRVKTITSDNGREFANYKEIEKKLNCKYYFARPYASYERGTVERMNREIRMFYPKRTDFLKISNEDFKFALSLINFKPRTCLNDKSPHNAFFKNW